jgi:hypothetical protein
MRTHLLRAVYPGAEIAEPDTGRASNDEYYAGNPSRAMTSVGHALLPSPPDAHDQYHLGGYAGI